jgi:hypothetical protein
VKKTQIQMFYVFFLPALFFLSGCKKYPNLNDCPKVSEKPKISFEQVGKEISSLKKEINHQKKQIQEYNASL